MKFKLESEMTGPVYNWLIDQGLATKKEFVTPWGICDLVGTSLNIDNAIDRLSYEQYNTITSVFKAMLLSQIPDFENSKTITTKRLYNLFREYYSPTRISIELGQLTKNRFIKSPKQNHYYKLNGWMPLHKRIVAIELKLNRTQEALYQAYNHCRFTNESYVALPFDKAERIINSKRKIDFLRSGIGLLSVDINGCKILINAASSIDKVDCNIQTYLVDRFWKDFIKGN